jgi:hypothetical protein
MDARLRTKGAPQVSEQVCNCGKPTRNNAYVCDDCLGGLTKTLAEMTWLAGELETTIRGERGIDYRALGGSPGNEKPMPYNLPAAEARRTLRNALHTAVRFCDEEQIRHQSRTNTLPVDSLEAMSHWLMWRVDGLGLSDMGWEFIDSIQTASQKCRYLVDRKPERRYAGPCECGRDLYHKPSAAQVQCRDCERTYEVAELYEWMRKQVRDRLVTARDGAALLCRFDLETQQGTIDKWHERGRIVAHGHDAKRRRLYLMDDLINLAAKHLAKSS